MSGIDGGFDLTDATGMRNYVATNMHRIGMWYMDRVFVLSTQGKFRRAVRLLRKMLVDVETLRVTVEGFNVEQRRLGKPVLTADDMSHLHGLKLRLEGMCREIRRQGRESGLW